MLLVRVRGIASINNVQATTISVVILCVRLCRSLRLVRNIDVCHVGNIDYDCNVLAHSSRKHTSHQNGTTGKLFCSYSEGKGSVLGASNKLGD